MARGSAPPPPPPPPPLPPPPAPVPAPTILHLRSCTWAPAPTPLRPYASTPLRPYPIRHIPTTYDLHARRKANSDDFGGTDRHEAYRLFRGYSLRQFIGIDKHNQLDDVTQASKRRPLTLIWGAGTHDSQFTQWTPSLAPQSLGYIDI